MLSGSKMINKVLVIDDDERYLQLLEVMLEGVAETTVTSTRGLDYFKLVKVHKPDIVLMDILIQDVNGLEIVERAQLSEEHECVPTVFISAWTGSGNIKLPRNSVRLFKPFTLRDLVDTIERLLCDESGQLTYEIKR